MSENEAVNTVVREWVVKAENDLKAAMALLRLRTSCPTDVVCFHAQQSVEKYLKAALAAASVDFPKTHDVEKLISLLPAEARPPLSLEEQANLTEYATEPAIQVGARLRSRRLGVRWRLPVELEKLCARDYPNKRSGDCGSKRGP